MLTTPFDNICKKSTLLLFILSMCVTVWYALYLPLSTGVSSYKVDLETKIVVVMGDILPSEVLQSVSKVKNAELWNFQASKE